MALMQKNKIKGDSNIPDASIRVFMVGMKLEE